MPPMPPAPHPHPQPFPNRFPVIYLRPVQSCRNIYHNQNTLDGLNAILHGCDDLKKDGKINCNAEFISRVEKRLMEEMSIARLIGTNCAQPTVY